MWNPKYLILENILSHEYTRIDLNKEVLNISGENKTNQGQKSNGSGKSATVDGFSLAILGTPTRYNSNKKCIRWGEKFGGVEMYFENDFLKKTLLIKREFNRNKSEKVQIEEDGKLREDLKDLKPSEVNKEILNIIGISSEDIYSYYILTRDTHQPFFSITDGAKKKVINRFSNINLINPSIDKVKEDIKTFEQEKKDLEEDLIVFRTKIDTKNQDLETLYISQEQIEEVAEYEREKVRSKISLKQEDIKNEKANLKTLKATLKSFNGNDSKTKIKSLEESIDSLENYIEEQEEDLDKKKEEKDSFSVTIEELEDAKTFLEEDLRALDRKKASLELILEGAIDCPKCSHEFVINSEITIPQAEKEIEDIEKSSHSIMKTVKANYGDIKKQKEKQKEISDEIKDASQEIKQLDLELKDLRDELSDLKKNEYKVSDTKELISSSENRIKMLTSQKADLEKQLSEVEPEDIYEPQINSIKKEIESFESELKNINLDLQDVDRDVEETTECISILKSYQSHLANQAINSIEQSTNDILEKLNTDLSVSIEGYRLLANGKDLKEEISVTINRPDKSDIEFVELSGGEKARTNLANIIANQEMINSCSETGGLDLLVFDEVMDSLDQFGLSSVFNALQNLNKNIVFISHVKTNSLANEIVIEKVNGISKIKEEEK